MIKEGESMERASRLVLSIMIAITISVGSPILGIPGEGIPDAPIGILDGYIAGTVVNGTSGITVLCQATKDQPPQTPVLLNFTDITGPSGEFNITVDTTVSGSGGYTVNNYILTIGSTYYLDVSKGLFNLPGVVNSTETFHVPDGSLEMKDALTGNLTVRILNESSGAPLEGVEITVSHVADLPAMPFFQPMITDPSGEVTYDDIRATETEVEATLAHFRDLSSTVTENNVLIGHGGDTIIEFNLTENPWPFTTTPSDGASSINISGRFQIDFGLEMNVNTITNADNYLYEDSSGHKVNFTIPPPLPGNDRVVLVPDEPLEYDTNYMVSIYARLLSFTGTKPLWRSMDIGFSTELRPATLSGRLVDSFSGVAAANMEVHLVDQISRSGPDGFFEFPLVIPGTHDLLVSDGYLFHGYEVEDIDVGRGMDIDLGNVSLDPYEWGMLNVSVTSNGDPLEGAWVQVLSTMLGPDEFNQTTGPTGVTSFPRVRTGNVNLVGGAPHHHSKVEVAIVNEQVWNHIALDLEEEPFPVLVELTNEISSGIADVSSDLLITMPEAILFQSLNVSLWMLDGDGKRTDEIGLSPPQDGPVSNSYMIRVQGDLPLEKDLEFVIGKELKSLVDGAFILWRELTFRFTTPEVPLAYMNGTLLLEGIPLDGAEISVLDQSGETDNDGHFNVSIDLSEPSRTGLVMVNMTSQGYRLFQKEVTVRAGSTLEMGTITLLPFADWYSVVPVDGSTDVDPGTNISMNFKVSLVEPSGGWPSAVKLIKEGSSAPVSGSYTLSGGNRTLVFQPSSDLTENAEYRVRITDDLLQERSIPVFPVGNSTFFRIRPPEIVVEIIAPTVEEADAFPLDGAIVLSFGISLNRSRLQGSVDFDPAVQGLSFDWVSGAEVGISALLAADTTYTISIPSNIYGIDNEPLISDFELTFTTSDKYAGDHSFISLVLIPEPSSGWEAGELVTISGTVGSSAGYQVKAVLGEGSSVVSDLAIVEQDGTFSFNMTLPSEEMEGTLRISIGVPGGPDAYSKDFEVKIGPKADNNGGDGKNGDDQTIYLILGAVMIVLLLIIGAFLLMRYQRKKAEEAMDIDYSDVEGEWEDPEE